jgi:hypothetical protein
VLRSSIGKNDHDGAYALLQRGDKAHWKYVFIHFCLEAFLVTYVWLSISSSSCYARSLFRMHIIFLFLY